MYSAQVKNTTRARVYVRGENNLVLNAKIILSVYAGLPKRRCNGGLFNIPPHFPPAFRLPLAVVVSVPRKRSRSMRKLPRQELLTINYSRASRYPRLRAAPFRALSTVTHANDGRARGPQTQHSLLTHRYTKISETNGERHLGSDIGANCREFTFYCAHPRQTAGYALGSLFVSYLLHCLFVCVCGCVVSTPTRALVFETRENFDIYEISISIII